MSRTARQRSRIAREARARFAAWPQQESALSSSSYCWASREYVSTMGLAIFVLGRSMIPQGKPAQPLHHRKFAGVRVTQIHFAAAMALQINDQVHEPKRVQQPAGNQVRISIDLEPSSLALRAVLFNPSNQQVNQSLFRHCVHGSISS